MRMIFGVSAPLASAVFLIFAASAALCLRLKNSPKAVKILRIFSLSAILLAVLSPSLVFFRRTVELPRVAVLIDGSYTMGLGGKYQKALAWAGENLEKLSKACVPSVYVFSGGISPVDLKSAPAVSRSQSDLGAALERLSREAAPARILVITDGFFDAEKASGRLSALGIPADFLVPAKRPEKSVSVEEMRAGSFAFCHIPFVVRYKLSSRGVSGVRAKLSEAGKELASAYFKTPAEGGIAESTFTVSAGAAGERKLVFEAGAPGAKTERRTFSLKTLPEKRRILYLCGRPSHEYGFLRDFIKSDPDNELVTFVVLRKPLQPQAAPEKELSLIPFPADEIFGGDLKLFDALVLENFSFASLGLEPDYGAAVSEFVKNGGGLLTLGGRQAYSELLESPAGEVLAAAAVSETAPGKFKPLWRPSLLWPEAGFWPKAPALSDAAGFSGLKDGASAALESEDGAGKKLPLAVICRSGKGRVMSLGSDSTWRWKMLAAPSESGIYGEFWGRTLDYLSGRLDVKPVSVSVSFSREGAPAEITVSALGKNFRPVSGAKITAYFVSETGKRVPLSFSASGGGVFTAGIARAPRRLSIRARVESGGILVGEDAVSVEIPSADLAGADFSALQKSGSVYTLSGFDFSVWEKKLPQARAGEIKTFSVNLGGAGWLLAAILLLCAEWIFRRLRSLL